MGGAVTLLLHRKDPAFWNGAILVAPMCKVIHGDRSTRYTIYCVYITTSYSNSLKLLFIKIVYIVL